VKSLKRTPVAREIPGTSIPTFVVEDARDAARAIAAQIEALIRANSRTVLGLATGHTPIATYEELVALHRGNGLSFAEVTTFNLDEYFGLPAGHLSSFRSFMHERLFDRIDLPLERSFFPDGARNPSETAAACEAYETAIRETGGIDLQLLGIGRNGHIAFNEPGSPRDSRTRLIELSESTRSANAPDFPPGESPPRAALTMGIATIMEAKRLRVLALGKHKAEIVREVLEGAVGDLIPATFLRGHADVELWIDREAAGGFGG
jgi:glucosamine-6-phosphate deaminase